METEEIWSRLLSQDDEQITETFIALNEEEKQTVLLHLETMTSEDGWHPLQVESASHALSVLKQNS